MGTISSVKKSKHTIPPCRQYHSHLFSSQPSSPLLYVAAITENTINIIKQSPRQPPSNPSLRLSQPQAPPARPRQPGPASQAPPATPRQPGPASQAPPGSAKPSQAPPSAAKPSQAQFSADFG